MEIVSWVPVATRTYWDAEVGVVNVITLLVESISTPHEVPVFRQLVRDSGLATLNRNGVPVAMFRSPQVKVFKLNCEGNVTDSVLEAVPKQGGEEQAWDTSPFWVVKAKVWFEVADTLELFRVSDRLVTCAPWEVSTRENQKKPIPKRRVRARKLVEWLRTASAISKGAGN